MRHRAPTSYFAAVAIVNNVATLETTAAVCEAHPSAQQVLASIQGLRPVFECFLPI